MTPTVVVLDGEERSALAVVRSLGRGGYQVHVGAGTRRSIAGGSRFALSEALLPSPLAGGLEYVQAVAQMVKERNAPVLLPVTEASTLALLERQELFSGITIPTSDLTRFRRAADKAAVLALAPRLGIDVPEQWIHSGDPGEPITIPADVYPVVVKPSRSVVGAEGARQKMAVSYANSQEDLLRIISHQGREAGPFLIQRRVEGQGVGVFLLRWEGRILATFAHRRIREKPPSGGVSVCSESVRFPADLVDKSERLLESLEWSGVAMVEYKQDLKSGRAYLMEINPRFWGSLQLAIDAGVDFPTLLVAAALGTPIEPVRTWRVGLRSRWWWGDVDHLLTRLRHSRRDLNLPPGTAGRLRTFLTVLRAWRPGQRSDVFSLSDPLPGVRETIAWLRAL